MGLVRDKLLRRQQSVEQKIGALSYQALKLLEEIKALERDLALLDVTRRDLDTEEAIAKAKDLKPDQEAEKKA